MTMELSTLSTRHFKASLIFALITALAACGGGGGGGDTGPSLEAPALENAPAQSYAQNVAIEALRLSNSGGGELTSCRATSLPAGLNVAVSSDGASCVISGTPAVVSSQAAYTITAINPTASSSASVTMAVNLLAPILAGAPLQAYFLDRIISPLSLANSGGGALTSCTADSLPPGLSVAVSSDGTSCTITGTPTVTSVETTYTITATNVTDSSSASIPMEVTQRAFISIWKTDNYGSTDDNQVLISTGGTASNYTVDWGDGSQNSEITGDITHTYASLGTYTVTIRGDLPRIVSCGSDNKMLSVEQWGDIQWQSMGDAFKGCTQLVVNASDSPNLSQVTNMNGMFFGASTFNQDISDWDVSAVTDMAYMFYQASIFNQGLSGWDVSAVTNMEYMFNGARTFNRGLSGWDVSAVTNMEYMFGGAMTFNQDLSGWDVSAVTTMSSMFRGARAFNQDLSGWDVSAVTTMYIMFATATAFNQNISLWDVSAVTNMRGMFTSAIAFNQDLSGWDVSAVTDMGWMFDGARAFNQDLGDWDVSAVIDMGTMFFYANAFNQDLSGWDVSAVTNMGGMFSSAIAFNQDLSGWNVSAVSNMGGMFDGVTLSTSNYDALLAGWSVQSVQSNVSFDGGNSQYSSASQDARDTLTGSPFNWAITDGGVAPAL